jgi:iron complex outermembrane receptor protein
VDALRVELFGGARLDESSLLGAAVVSPRAGASFGTPRLGARLSWGRAFSPPSLVDQFFQEGVRARPNPDLRPERVRGEVELAGDLRAATLGPATLDASVAAYQADVQGMIIWAPNFRFEWRPENVDVRRRGVDATAQARFRPAAAELRAAVSRVAVEYATPALRGQVVYRPRTTASAGAAATLAGMRADVGARYVGARRTAPGSALNLLPAYTVTDLRVERPFTWAAWHGAVSLGIDDLLDHQPATLVDFPSPGRAWRLGVRASRSTAGRPPP